MLISNIKLAILNMHQYVQSRAVVLPGDRPEDDGNNKSVQDQLASIISHIEDLVEVNHRVTISDVTNNYNDPLLSEQSELRLEFRENITSRLFITIYYILNFNY